MLFLVGPQCTATSGPDKLLTTEREMLDQRNGNVYPLKDVLLKVFTLNCWGLKLLSKNRKQRFKAIEKFLQKDRYDIVFLQEVWVRSDYDQFKHDLQSILPYSNYFESGVIGSGICIFTRVPIQHSFFVPFEANGYFYKVWHGDWFTGKGVGICRIILDRQLNSSSNSLTVNLVTTHTHVETEGSEYVAHRLTQAVCLVDIIKLCSDAADVTILAGDMNSDANGQLLRLVLELGNMTDTLTKAKSISTDPSILGTYPDIGGTCGLPTNSYSAKSYLKRFPSGSRLDYVLFRARASTEVTVNEYKRPLPNRVPGTNISYSDHEGVAVEFCFRKLSCCPFSQSALSQPKATGGFFNIKDDDKKVKADELIRHISMITVAITVLDNSFIVLKRRLIICCFSGAFLFAVLLGTLYHRCLPIPASIVGNFARVVLSCLAFVLGIVQPLHIRLELYAIRAAFRSFTFKKLALDAKIKKLRNND